jgi:hypothetical protein
MPLQQEIFAATEQVAAILEQIVLGSLNINL